MFLFELGLALAYIDRVQKKSDIIVRAHAVSDIGQRKKNEDAYLIDAKTGLFLVADGMGGHDKGEVASWFASTNLNKIIKILKSAACEETFDALSDIVSRSSEDELLKYAVLSTSWRIFEENEMNAEKITAPPGSAEAEFQDLVAKKKRMGTTLVSLYFSGDRVFVTNVGDSRAYRVCPDSFVQLTVDHSWVGERVREGTMTADEASLDRRRNLITRSLGFKHDVTADIKMLTLSPPERFLLCSDGLSGVVGEEDLHRISMKPNFKEACIEMVELAKDMGGRDNITAMLVDITRRGMAEIDTDPPSFLD